MDLRRLSEHYADIGERAQPDRALRGLGQRRSEEEGREGERRRTKEGRVGGSARGHGHLEHDTKKPKDAIWSVLQPTHANLQIRIVKVRHCSRVGGGLRPSFGDTTLRPRICSPCSLCFSSLS
ncbi:hypothetical protein K0M31_001372 [Melipona bicolor]|uniref:Uncharacterized protein n=1 Tax=Melipona bicolor TaxID=60889 RepID=A0AA40KXQ0_9HYME|nr:hypothetical protein K0M31_001372 [Melipona bicolor]